MEGSRSRSAEYNFNSLSACLFPSSRIRLPPRNRISGSIPPGNFWRGMNMAIRQESPCFTTMAGPAPAFRRGLHIIWRGRKTFASSPWIGQAWENLPLSQAGRLPIGRLLSQLSQITWAWRNSARSVSLEVRPYVLACAAMIPERLTGSAVLAGMVPLPLTRAGASGLHPLYRAMMPFRKSPAAVFSGLFRVAARVSAGQPGKFPLSALVRSLASEDRALLLSSPDVWEVATTSFAESVSEKGCGRGVMADSEIYFQNPGFNPATITHPIRYWHGGDDKNIPTSLVEDLVSNMPYADLTVEPDLGHFSLAVHRASAALDHVRDQS